jgi:hypothetical protein
MKTRQTMSTGNAIFLNIVGPTVNREIGIHGFLLFSREAEFSHADLFDFLEGNRGNHP